MLVYPNPASDIVSVDFNLENSSLVELSVINILGKKVIEVIPNEKFERGNYHYNINIDNLPVGIYIISYEENNRVTTQKVFIR